MIKIFIIDDETPIRQWIRFCIERSDSCFEVIGEASNGEVGLRALETTETDIVILDIMMPGLNGLEVLTRLKEIRSDLSIIMLTNFAEFKYIQKAVRNGAVEYFLKSEITEESLMNCLNKVASTRKQSDLLLNLSSEAESRTIHHLCEQILSQVITSHTQFLKASEQYPKPLSYAKNLFVIAIRYMPGNPISLSDIPLSDISEHLSTMHQIIHNGNDYFLICEMNKLNSQLMIFHSIAQMLRWICSNLSFAYIGISNIYHNFSGLYHALTESLLSLSSGFYKKPGSVTYIYENKHQEIDHNILVSYNKEVLNIAKTGTCSELEMKIRHIFEYFRQITPVDIQAIKDFFLELLYLVHSVSMSNSQQFQFLDKSIHMKFRKQLFDCIFLDHLEGIVLELLSLLYGADTQTSYSAPVEDAIFYIKEHYCENITLKETADAVHMNADYLGKLFKKETGISFNAYVTSMKMEYADYLIRNTNLKKYEIAEKLGFTNFSYFSRIYSAYKSK